jgi:FG-GAP repeat
MSHSFARGLGAFARWIAISISLISCVAISAEPTLKMARIEGSKLQLTDSYELSRSDLKRASNRQALSLASGDVDGDGFPDLLSGYSSDTGGVVTLHRGNKEAWAPSTPESLALVRNGSFPPGFESASTEWMMPIAPDFMVSGDFNGDGRADVVIAQRGHSSLYFLAGQRTGFAAPIQIKLEGGVDAIAAGLLDSRDGFPKLIAAVSTHVQSRRLGAATLARNRCIGNSARHRQTQSRFNGRYRDVGRRTCADSSRTRRARCARWRITA